MNNYLPASGSFVNVGDLRRLEQKARQRARMASLGLAGLGDLSGSATKAMLNAALVSAQKNAEAVAGRVQIGSMVALKYDPNWAYDPAGDLNLLYWVGTGDQQAAPEGYVQDPKLMSQGKFHVYRWKGFGISIAQREVQQAQAAAQAQADAQAKAQAQAEAAQAQANAAVAAAQAIVESAIGNAQIMAKQGNFTMAINTLNDPRVVKAAAAAGSTAQLQNVLSNLVDAQNQAKSTGDTKADAQSALDDALTAAKTLARKGRFDEADAMIQQAQGYARAIGGFSAKSEINSAQIFVDGLRQQADAAQQQAAAAQAAQAQAQANARAEAEAAAALRQQQADAAAAAARAQAEAATQQQQAQLQFQAMQLQAQMQMQAMQLQARQAAMPTPPSNTPAGGFAPGPQYSSGPSDPLGYGSQNVSADSGYGGGGESMGPPPVTYGGYSDPSQAQQTFMGPSGVFSESDAGSVGFDSGDGGGDSGGDWMAGLGEMSPEEQATARAQARARQWGLGHLVLGGVALVLLARWYKNRRGR